MTEEWKILGSWQEKGKNMDKKDILSRVDHTLLSQTATWEEIRQILDDGIKYGCASACIPACYVKQAAEYVDGDRKSVV